MSTPKAEVSIRPKTEEQFSPTYRSVDEQSVSEDHQKQIAEENVSKNTNLSDDDNAIDQDDQDSWILALGLAKEDLQAL